MKALLGGDRADNLRHREIRLLGQRGRGREAYSRDTAEIQPRVQPRVLAGGGSRKALDHFDHARRNVRRLTTALRDQPR